MKVYKVMDTGTGLFKKSTRSYSYQDYWSKIGNVYTSKGAASLAKQYAQNHSKGKVVVKTYELVEVSE
jgi:hypothetical protein